jgi:membrane protein DedA with SNARE-associated domain
MSEAIEETLRASPWAGLLIVMVMAWLEYIFPPVPGDSTMLFACFLAGAGALPLGAAALACLAGSVAGACSAYAIGARLGHSYFFLRSAWARAELGRLERGFARYGAPLLVVNRFLPGVRGVFLYGAGIGRLGWRRVLIYSTVSNALWVGLIAWAGTGLGASWDEVRVVFRRYVWAIAIAMTLYAIVAIVRARRGRASPPVSRAS